jgi:hypothetical protein
MCKGLFRGNWNGCRRWFEAGGLARGGREGGQNGEEHRAGLARMLRHGRRAFRVGKERTRVKSASTDRCLTCSAARNTRSLDSVRLVPHCARMARPCVHRKIERTQGFGRKPEKPSGESEMALLQNRRRCGRSVGGNRLAPVHVVRDEIRSSRARESAPASGPWLVRPRPLISPGDRKSKDWGFRTWASWTGK